MQAQEYQIFTNALKRGLEDDSRVIGLMAAGSMANLSHPPDEWSDHDFWVIVNQGDEHWFHTHQEWLPNSDQLVLFFREAVHGGLKAVYNTGHMLEFAVSDRSGLLHAKVNDYLLLIDRAELAKDLARMHRDTEREFQESVRDDLCLMGQFLTNLQAGVGRYRRGEKLSARHLITVSSLHALLRLIPKHIPSGQSVPLDNLDPLRRIEAAYPIIGEEINQLLQRDLDHTAIGLLDLADNLLRNRISDYPSDAVEVIMKRIST